MPSTVDGRGLFFFNNSVLGVEEGLPTYQLGYHISQKRQLLPKLLRVQLVTKKEPEVSEPLNCY